MLLKVNHFLGAIEKMVISHCNVSLREGTGFLSFFVEEFFDHCFCDDSSMFGRRCVPKVWADDFHLFFRFFLWKWLILGQSPCYKVFLLGKHLLLSQRKKPVVWYCLMAAHTKSSPSLHHGSVKNDPIFACSNVLVVFVHFRLILGRDKFVTGFFKSIPEDEPESPLSSSGVLKDQPLNRPWDMISFGWVFVATCFL